MTPFEAYTLQHWLPLIFFLVLGIVVVRMAKKSSEQRQVRIGVLLAVLTWLPMFIGSLLYLVNGTYDVKEDLPVYLCRIAAWAMPFVMWKRTRYWLGIFYFWILAGTLQANFTPDLSEGFPDFYFFRYWFLHAGLVVTMLYAVIVFKLRITWKDLLRAILWAQAYLVLIHGFNVLLGSNYSYTVEKPPGGSILDLFGEWPWYVLGGEGLMIVLFVLLMLPFAFRKRPAAAHS